MHWGARQDLMNAAKTTFYRIEGYAGETKKSLILYNPKNDLNSWDEKLDQDIAKLERKFDNECLWWFSQLFEEHPAYLELDEEDQLEIKPFIDQAKAKFVEFMTKTIEGLKKRPVQGWSKGYTVEDWGNEYGLLLDDLADYVADMNNDINDGVDSE
jgi:hypothetical protein